MDEYRLKVENVTKRFPGTVALSNVSLDIRPGEIHAVVGENGAGKSTLMNIIGGVFPATSGSVYLDGQRTHFRNAEEAQKSGIGFVHQELSVFPHLSVAYNIFVDRLPKTPLGFIDKKKLNDNAREVLKQFDADIRPETRLSELTVGKQQMVEIARAISLDCKLIIFDEPTSSLTEKETVELLAIIRRLRENNVSILYITHRLGEIFQVCDRVTVLKDGEIVDTLNIADTTMNEVIGCMIGRELSNFYPPLSSGISEEIFRVEDFTGIKHYRNISFSLKKGEVLGFYGLLGAGRSEVMRAICGIDPKVRGQVYLYGEQLNIRKYQDALKKGISYLTEDRKLAGIFPILSIKKNLYISALCCEKGFWLSEAHQGDLAEADVANHAIKTPSVETPISSLSGGNQQKVLIARNLRVEPSVIILDEPTRGIDVNAKAEIHKKIRALAESGIGVIIISSEMPEIIGMSDRVIVMYEGEISGSLQGDQITENNIIKLAASHAADIA